MVDLLGSSFGMDPSGLYGAGNGLYSGLLAPQQQSMLNSMALGNMGAAIASASGPSRLPVPLGTALGAGAQAFNQTRLLGGEQLLRATLMGQEAKRSEIQNQFLQARLNLLQHPEEIFGGGNSGSGATSSGNDIQLLRTGDMPGAGYNQGAGPSGNITNGQGPIGSVPQAQNQYGADNRGAYGLSPDLIRTATNLDILMPGAGKALLGKYATPTDFQRAWNVAENMPVGPARALAMINAMKIAGVPEGFAYNAATGGFVAVPGGPQDPRLLASQAGAKAAAAAAATYPYDISKSYVGQGLTPNGAAPNPAIPALAKAKAEATLGPDVLTAAARFAFDPRALTPTERMVSPFTMLPPEIQNVLRNAATGGPPQAATSSGQTIQPTLGRPADFPSPANAAALQPTLGRPADFPSPANAAALSNAPAAANPSGGQSGVIPAAMSPAQFEAQAQFGKDFATKDTQAFSAANQGLLGLGQMINAAELLNQSGWSSTGTGANGRLELAKGLNTWETAFGFRPSFDPQKVASWENLEKEANRMGMQLITQNFGGSREAQSIIKLGVQSVPHAENTYMGFRLVASSVEQALQRERDLYNYKAQVLASGGNPITAEADFNMKNPPSIYTKRAIANAIPDQAVQALQQNPKLAPQFNQKYGNGMSDFILSGGRPGLGAVALQ